MKISDALVGVRKLFLDTAPVIYHVEGNAAYLPLTDVVINPTDRAMYFTIGGRGVQSGLYRVTYVGDEPTSPAATQLNQGELQKTRRLLEASPPVQTNLVRTDPVSNRRV